VAFLIIMKRLVFISLILLSRISVAQTPFAIDEHGKYILYEVVELNGTVKDSLTNRAKLFLKSIAKNGIKMESSTSDSVLNATGKFLITKTSAMLSHPSGEVNYHFVAEIKNGKYRYWLTDFKFTPYQQDRYGVFVPIIGVSTPLEKSPGKLNASAWKDYISDAADQAKKFGVKFKEQMAAPIKSKPVEKSASPISTGKW
jgi:hypothetical protein